MSKVNQLTNQLGGKVEQIVQDKETAKYIDWINKLAQHPTTIEYATKGFRKIDQLKVTEKARKYWNSLSPEKQWVANKLVKFDLLAEIGLLADEKSSKNLSEKINQDREKQKKMAEMITKYGQHLDPELASVEPFVAPIFELKKVKNDWLEKIRHNLLALREQDSKSQQDIVDISSKTHQKVENLRKPLN